MADNRGDVFLTHTWKLAISVHFKQEGWLSPTKRASTQKKPRAEDM